MGSHRDTVIAACALTALAFAQPSIAQERPRRPPRNVIAVDPLGAVFAGVVYVAYERAVHPYVSVFVGPQIQFGRGLFYRGNDDDDLFGAGIEAGARVYVSGEAPIGIFLSPQLEVSYVSLRRGYASGSGVGFGGAALIGYQRIFAQRFVVSAGIGVRYQSLSATVTAPGSSSTAHVAGFSPAVHGALGVAF